MNNSSGLKCWPEIEIESGDLRWSEEVPFFGGVDGGTSVSVYGSPVSDHVLAALERARERGNERHKHMEADVAGVRCLVCPAPKGQIGYSYSLRLGGVTVLLHRNPCGRIPVAKIVYEWEACNYYNLISLHQHVLAWLDAMGVEIHAEHLTRLDIQVSAGMPIGPFWSAMERGHYHCRQKLTTRIATEEPECITFGTHKSPIMFRCYDKVRETFGNSSSKFQALAQQFGDYDVLMEPVTRFEFESHRPFLRTLGIHTFTDFLEHSGGFVEYLCKWLRFTESRQNNHSERNTTLPEWERVRIMFSEVFVQGGNAMGLDRLVKTPGGHMTYEQRLRTQRTVSTLLARLAVEHHLETGDAPLDSLKEVFRNAACDAKEKLDGIMRDEVIQNPANLYPRLTPKKRNEVEKND